jgi:hypothetical protein
VSNVILGSDFAVENGLIIDFNLKSIKYEKDGEMRSVELSQGVGVEVTGTEQVEGDLQPAVDGQSSLKAISH